MSRIADFFSAAAARAAARPWLTLLLLLAAQTVPALVWSRELWFADEARHGNVLQNLLQSGNWSVLHLNGRIYPDKPPLYFWFLALLAKLFQSDRPFVFFTGLALSAWLLLAATWLLARRVAGADKKIALGSVLVLLTTFYFAGACHYTRMDLMFSAWIVLSQICLFQAWTREKSGGWAVAGFALAGVAALTKGPFGFLFPFLASVFFLVWQNGLKHGLRRLVRADVLLGLGLALLIPAAWLLAAYGRDKLEAQEMFRLLVDDQSRRLTNSFMHPRPFYYYALLLPVVWMPWSLLLGGLPFKRLFESAFWSGLRADRGRSEHGTVFLWAMILAAFLTLSCVSIKIEIYLLPLFAPLAVLTARKLFELPPPALRRVWIGMTVLFLLLALAAGGAGWFFTLPGGRRGVVAVAVLFTLLGLVLFCLRRRSAGPLFACLLVGVTVFANLAALVVMPSLDPVMSPQAQGEQLGGLARRHYFPAAYRMVHGLHSYYARCDIYETWQPDDLVAQLQTHPKAALLIQKKDWEKWTDQPAGFRIVSEQRLASYDLLLLVREGPR